MILLMCNYKALGQKSASACSKVANCNAVPSFSPIFLKNATEAAFFYAKKPKIRFLIYTGKGNQILPLSGCLVLKNFEFFKVEVLSKFVIDIVIPFFNMKKF